MRKAVIDMKSVLISIQPKWCELIASGKKTVEVRRTKPKIDVPFKCYIYCTKGDWLTSVNVKVQKPNNMVIDLSADSKIEELNGKVIGEFVCDFITPFRPKALLGDSQIVKASCVKIGDLIEYSPNKPFPQDHIYGWHITDLVIYEQPKELNEFRTPCKMTEGSCYFCDYAVHGMDGDLIDCDTSLTRPPRSWCYCEELLPSLVEPKGKTITIPKWTYYENKGE
jgi:predicted transcriptional regulator